MRTRTALVALLSIGCLQTASAGTITKYNRATFQSAVSSTGLSGQNFDALPLGTITTVNGVTYMPSMGAALVTGSYLTTSGSNGLGSTSTGFFLPSESLTLSFASAVTAFAIDINTFAPVVGAYQVTLNDGAGSVVSSLFDVFPGTSTGQFIGFIDSTSFSTVVLTALSGYSYTVDTLAYGAASSVITAAVPEASSWALMGSGLALLLVGAKGRGTRRSRPAARLSPAA